MAEITPLPGIRDVFATTLETVTDALAKATPGTEAIFEVATGAVRGAVAMGSDLVLASKAIVVGVFRGTGAKEDAALQILSQVSKTVVHHTADRGGDLAAATKGLVLGAIASAKAIGVDAAKAASTAAQGAHDGAAQAGSVTVERVMAALKEPIGGIKVATPQRQGR